MKYRLLVVDDERSILTAMNRYFSLHGFAVHTTRELEEAAALVTRYSYDAAIVDLQLTQFKGSEGLELLRLIRERRPETQTIVLTAYGSPQVEAEARRLGVKLFLAKPKPLPEVAREVLGLLGVVNERADGT